MKIKLFFFLLCLPISAICQLNLQYNAIRIGDVIIKQQVEFQDPGDSGIDKLWNFRKLKVLNDSYELSYSAPRLLNDSIYVMGYDTIAKQLVKNGELIVGTEHNTMYYYQIKNDTLYLLGHEKPTVKFKYVSPLVMMTYPANYGQTSEMEPYSAYGLYSGTEPILIKGKMNMSIDAFGKMILPTGDTINPVLRVKSEKTIEMEDGTNNFILETYSWYTKGYRYPLFECIRNINRADNSEGFSTAFFYPPQEHYYMENDPANQALLDELWAIEHRQQAVNKKETANKAEIILLHKVYPNPVSDQLTVEYTLEERSDVQILLVASNGIVVRNIQKRKLPEGFSTETIYCSDLMPGAYHLKLVAGNQAINQTVVKK